MGQARSRESVPSEAKQSGMSRRMLELDGRHMELRSFCIDGKTNGLLLRGLRASRLIMFARALSQELRDDELTVSFDHCSRWEAPQGNETGALTRKATRQSHSTQH